MQRVQNGHQHKDILETKLIKRQEVGGQSSKKLLLLD